MKVSEIMRRNVVSINDDDTLELATQIMLWSEIHHLPVLHEGRLIGLLSERDILRHRARRDIDHPRPAIVREAMSMPPHYATADEAISTLSGRMADEHLGAMPILEAGKLVGIVTTTDILKSAEVEQFGAVAALQGDGTAVSAIMTRDLVTAGADDRLADALGRMRSRGVRHLPIIRGDGTLVGMLSDRDFRLSPEVLRQGSASTTRRYLEETRVAQVMSRPATAIGPTTPLSVVVHMFISDRLSALPIVEESGRLIGIVSYVDALQALMGSPRKATDVAQPHAP